RFESGRGHVTGAGRMCSPDLGSLRTSTYIPQHVSATAAGYGPRIGDLIDPQLWDGRRDVGEVFACLRRDAPVSWQRDPSAEGFTAGPGYWAVVRHPDVVEVGTDPRRFSSEPTTSIR